MLFGRYAAMAGMAAAALSMAAAPVGALRGPEPLDPTSRRAYSRKRVSKWRKPGTTKKSGAFRYKGSRWAKRASKRGGNPARF